HTSFSRDWSSDVCSSDLSLSKLEGKPMTRPAGVARPILTLSQRREGAARRRLAALGLNECLSYSFIDVGSAELFGGGADEVRLRSEDRRGGQARPGGDTA